MAPLDAVVVGAGPNGLAAAIVLAREGLAVLLIEGDDTVGGGARTAELTLPGFLHDISSAIHPLGAASPLFRTLRLGDHGVEWVEPPLAVAHPLDDGTAASLTRDMAETIARLGADGDAYHSLVSEITHRWEDFLPDALAPLRIPSSPFLLARFGLKGLQSTHRLVDAHLETPRGRALFAGLAAHSMQPLSGVATAAIPLVLSATAHAVGWPFPRGGASRLSVALRSVFESLGGRIETGRWIRSLTELPPARAYLLDLTPAQLLALGGTTWSTRYRRALERFEYGPGVFKLDWALSEPVPWTAAECRSAGTLHLGGTFEEVAASEASTGSGVHAEKPFVLLAQPSVFDGTRAPRGRHVLWGYCHVPNGSTVDMTSRIEAQVERFAPGFRDIVLARHSMTAAQMQAYNPNLVGGDIGQGANTLRQLFFRPTVSLDPYRTSMGGVYLCSSSTPPGGGVHGMCGFHAARTALRHEFGIHLPRVPRAREAPHA